MCLAAGAEQRGAIADKAARHRPLPIGRPRLGLLLWFLPPARPFFLSRVGGTERPYVYGAGHTVLLPSVLSLFAIDWQLPPANYYGGP